MTGPTQQPPNDGRDDGAVPLAPSLGPVMATVPPAPDHGNDLKRIAPIAGISAAVGVVAALAASVLTGLIALITNVSFYGRVSLSDVSPADHRLGLLVVIVPVIGAIVVGLMARYGSAAIRGHGIPEAMEQVLVNESRIPFRMTFLKPVSAAISIGTGGPFGAEGPIIATGGALGSAVGQSLHVSAEERKTILAAGAAAGMTAIFGTPVSAVLLAIELLLFEYRARSLIPVALAVFVANVVRIAIHGPSPMFAMAAFDAPGVSALGIYLLIGALIGVLASWVTRALYALEDAFGRLPIHWMWWPAIGAVAVGLIGWGVPATFGVGYDNIEAMVNGEIAGTALAVLVGFKLLSWLIALGSGTSGGTLAPLFTIGGGAGALMGAAFAKAVPAAGVDPRVGALVGMAAMFAGATHAVMASVVFAFEVTRQPLGLLPLLAGCTAAYFVALLHNRHSIMTHKLARRGTRVSSGYGLDDLDQVLVRAVATRDPVTLSTDQTVAAVRRWMAEHGPGSGHQGYPVVSRDGRLVGVVTRRDLFAGSPDPQSPIGDLVRRRAVVIFEDSSCREALDHMVREGVGRLVVVAGSSPNIPVGMITRSDLLRVNERRLRAADITEPTLVRRRAMASVSGTDPRP